MQLRWLRMTLRFILVIIAIFIIACYVFDQLVQFRKSDEEMNELIKKHNIPAKLDYYTSHGRRVRYISVGSDSLPTLLFIHGAPSSLSIYETYYRDTQFVNTFKMIAVDRPGYGYSGFGEPEPSIEKQAAIIKVLLDSLHRAKRPIIIAGSSYGSSIASRITTDYPHLVDGLILIAPSLAPGEEKIYWFSPYVEHPLLNWFVPRMLRSANTEKLAHRQELTKMIPYWKNIAVPVMYMQGDKDELLYTTNAVFAKNNLTGVPYLDIHFFPGRPHFIPFVERETIRRKILLMLQMLQEKKQNLK